MKEIIACDECFSGVRDGAECGLCNGSGLMQKMIIQLGGDIAAEMWVPSDLTQEEAQREFDEGLASLMNKFGLTN